LLNFVFCLPLKYQNSIKIPCFFCHSFMQSILISKENLCGWFQHSMMCVHWKICFEWLLCCILWLVDSHTHFIHKLIVFICFHRLVAWYFLKLINEFGKCSAHCHQAPCIIWSWGTMIVEQGWLLRRWVFNCNLYYLLLHFKTWELLSSIGKAISRNANIDFWLSSSLSTLE